MQLAVTICSTRLNFAAMVASKGAADRLTGRADYYEIGEYTDTGRISSWLN